VPGGLLRGGLLDGGPRVPGAALLPRQPRLDAPGVVHHVWARGIERRAIFADDVDRRDLIERLGDVLSATATPCFAWVFMSNHLHFVLRTGQEPLSDVMRRLLTGYAGQFNRRHERDGYLFQNRFGSRVVRDTADLLAVIRYVHRNPLEAGLVRDPIALAAFPWAGHGALLGQRPAWSFESVNEVLALFDAERDEARRRLAALVAEDLASKPAADDRRSGDPLAVIVGEECRRLGVSEEDLRGGRRWPAVARARAAVCWRAVRELGLPARDVAAALRVTPSAVSQALKRDRTF
jgi:REP element-mobilizing transposase RayT